MRFHDAMDADQTNVSIVAALQFIFDARNCAFHVERFDRDPRTLAYYVLIRCS